MASSAYRTRQAAQRNATQTAGWLCRRRTTSHHQRRCRYPGVANLSGPNELDGARPLHFLTSQKKGFR